MKDGKSVTQVDKGVRGLCAGQHRQGHKREGWREREVGSSHSLEVHMRLAGRYTLVKTGSGMEGLLIRDKYTLYSKGKETCQRISFKIHLKCFKRIFVFYI